MALLNYTTTIDAYKTVSEIEYILVKHKAKSIMKDYNDDGAIISLSFLIDLGYTQLPIKMPVKTEKCLLVLEKQKKTNKNIKATYDQAERVAWRNLKDWVEAQMALIDIDQVVLEEVFMPYIVDNNGKTLFDRVKEQQFLLIGE